MRITFYTPLALSSAIGRVAIGLADELQSRGHRVSFVRTERDRDTEAPMHPTKLPVQWWHDVLPREVAMDSDIVLLNIGDNFGFHAGIASIVDQAPCLGIFHDFFLYSFFRDWALANAGGGFSLHDAEVARIYGAPAGDIAKLAGNEWPLAEIARRFPMTEWLAGRCAGALAHSEFYRERLEAACAGPVAVTALSYAPRDVTALTARAGAPVSVLTVGHVNQNKCCAEVIQALARSANGKSCRYRIAGPIMPADRVWLETVAREAGFTGLDILDAVSDAELVEELTRADIVCCLRRPVLEGASASAIEAMMAGRPVIVANAGFYADLPDDLVFKVPPEVSTAALSETLDRLIADEPLRREVGAKVRDWSLKRFTRENYVDTLEALIDDVTGARPYLAVSSHFARELSALGLGPTDPAVEILGATLQGLFAPEERKN
jgi:glycosyltransferase involved in cell wall biosynthesis